MKAVRVNKDINEIDGQVWVSNGHVFVKNETGDGMPPLINPCNGVKLFINGEECNHIAIISEKDDIKLKAYEYEVDMVLEIEVSEDELKAYLFYEPSKIVKSTIVDSHPTNKLDIQVTQHTTYTNNLTIEKLQKFLKDSDIVFGIDEKKLIEICKKNEKGKYLIAKGLPPEDSTNDFIECYFEKETNVLKNKPKVDEYGNVDYRNISVFQTVSSGEIIAKLNKGKLGKSGTTVKGVSIEPAKVEEITIHPSFSVSYDEKTGFIRSNKAGRPSIQQKGNNITFHIEDLIIVDEVNMETGNIHFKGYIEINKNVCESMEVIAWHDVVVKGNVDFASIFAGNNITIKGNVVTSKINAAMNDVVAKDPTPLLQKLIVGIEDLICNIKIHVHYEKQQMSFSNLVRSLVNTKNKDLPMIIYKVMWALRKENYGVREEFILSLMKKTRSLMGNFSDIEDIDALYQIIADLKALTNEKGSNVIRGNVTLNSAVNSDITAFGNIHVLGDGCINSKLSCEGKAVITGYVRGGCVKAAKGIEINTAGTKRGSKTVLCVPEDSYIQLQTVYSDVTIKLGRFSHIFLTEKRMILARIEDGRLLF